MDYHLTYRFSRRLSIHVTGKGQVRVSAPVGTPESLIDEFVRSHSEWIEKSVKKTTDAQKAKEAFYSALPLTTKEEKAQAASKLDAIVKPMLEHYSSIMKVEPQSIRYKANKSKWGSCNTANRQITFSIYMLLLPANCIEHIVVHEMAHLIVPNHSKRFYKVMDKFFPDWKETVKQTRSITSL